MGYYTQYEIIVVGGDEDDVVDAIVAELDGFNPFDDDCKWYDYEKDCINVSKKFPDATIIISGVGEEHPDMWRAWFKNGKHKSCVANIEYIEPDW